MTKQIFKGLINSVDNKEQLPEGWTISRLGELITSIVDNRGKTPPTIEKSDESLPMVEVNSLTVSARQADISLCKKYVSRETYETWFRAGHPQMGDVLISTVGSVGQMAQVYDERICIAQNIISLRLSKYSNFLYELLKNMQAEIISIDISSVQPSIKVPHLLALEVIKPPDSLIEKFEKEVFSLVAKVGSNTNQNKNLLRTKMKLIEKFFKS